MFMNNQASWGSLAISLLMPFIASFHVSMGAPWIFTAFLTEVICIGLYLFVNRDKEINVNPDVKESLNE